MASIRECAANILKEHGCDCYTYGDKDKPYCQLSNIVKELMEAYPGGLEFPYEDVAQAILDISKQKGPEFEIDHKHFDFDDWGKWGVGDFYEKPELILREAIRSGKSFDTGWHGFRKEIESLRIQKNENEIIVSCMSSIDEIFEQTDLFFDFLTTSEMESLTDEIINEIRDYLMCGDFSEESEYSEVLPVNSDFDSIKNTAANLIQECHNLDKEHFREAISTTLFVLYGNSNTTEELIRKRHKECNCL